MQVYSTLTIFDATASVRPAKLLTCMLTVVLDALSVPCVHCLLSAMQHVCGTHVDIILPTNLFPLVSNSYTQLS